MELAYPKFGSKHFIAVAGIWALILCTVLSGCKKGDDVLPNAEILVPDSDVSAQADSVLRLEIRVTDDRALSSVSVQLSAVWSGQIVSSETVLTEGKEDIVEVNLALGNRYTEGGLYEIRARAFDEAGNASSDYLSVNLSPYPFLRLGAYAVTESGGQHTLYELDEDGGHLSSMAVDGFVDMAVNSKHQVVLTGSGTSGLSLYDCTDLSPLSGGVSTNAANFLALASYRDVTACTYGQSPTLLLSEDSPGYPTTVNDYLSPLPDVAVNEDNVYFLFGNSGGYVYQVSPGTGTFQDSGPRLNGQDHVETWGDSLVVCAGTDLATTKLRIFDAELNGYQDLSFSSDYRGCGAHGDSLFVLTGQSLNLVTLPGFAVSYDLVVGNFTCIAIDESRGEIWLGHSTGIYIFDLNGSWIRTIGGFNSGIVAISFRHNK